MLSAPNTPSGHSNYTHSQFQTIAACKLQWLPKKNKKPKSPQKTNPEKKGGNFMILKPKQQKCMAGFFVALP